MMLLQFLRSFVYILCHPSPSPEIRTESNDLHSKTIETCIECLDQSLRANKLVGGGGGAFICRLFILQVNI